MSANTYRTDADSSTVSPLDRPIPFTIIPDLSGATMHVEELSLRELAAKAKGTRRKVKKRLPLFNGAAFGDVLSDKGSLRWNENVTAVAAVVVDYDGGAIPIGAARVTLNAAGLHCLVMTSPTNGEPGRGHRWRVVLLLSRPRDRAAYADLVARVNGLFGGALDGGSFEPSRSYFLGHTGNITTYLVEGRRFLDKADDLDAGAIHRPGRERERAEHDEAEKWGRPLDVLRDALMAIPNDGSRPEHADRDRWLKIVAAVNFETDGSEEGFAVLDEWSRAWPGYDAEKTRAAWESFHRATGRVVTGWYIKVLAQEHGWMDPRIAEMFDDLAEKEREDAAWREAVDDIVGKPGGGFFESAASWTDAPPPREWLVEGLVPNKTVTLLGGDGGTGKSLLAMQLATAVATRANWLGRPVARPGVALFLSAEDDRDELRRRSHDIGRAEGLKPSALAKLLVRSMADEEPLLAMLDARKGLLQATPLYQSLDKAMAAARPSLLVLDTLADLHTGNENDRAQARQFIGLMRRLAIKHDCAVLLLAHPSLTGMASGSGLSGSTAWSNSVRSRLYFDRVKDSDGSEPNPDARMLRTVKANYGRIGGEIALHWRGGVFVASETFSDDESPLERARRVFLKLLDLVASQPGRYVSPHRSSTFAPTVFAAHPEAEGCTKAQLERAMETLFGDGTITTGEHGKGSRKSTHIRRANRGE